MIVTKTKEIVFRRPNSRVYIVVAPLFRTEQVKEFTLLGVTFSEDLRSNSVTFISKLSTWWSHIMKKLRDQGLWRKQLNIVFDANILSCIKYAACAWSSFLFQELKGRIYAFLLRMHKYGFCQSVFNFQEIAHDSDLGLYSVMLNDARCTH
jgi:Leu/Phe-tRNA-protein transferase